MVKCSHCENLIWDGRGMFDLGWWVCLDCGHCMDNDFTHALNQAYYEPKCHEDLEPSYKGIVCAGCDSEKGPVPGFPDDSDHYSYSMCAEWVTVKFTRLVDDDWVWVKETYCPYCWRRMLGGLNDESGYCPGFPFGDWASVCV